MPRHKYGSKPKNFPGRRNARRIAALERIEAQIASGVKQARIAALPLTTEDRDRLRREADILALRIRPHEAVRAIRTKKDRHGQGKLAR